MRNHRSRVKRLFRKTHRYISASDIRVGRDAFRAELEREGKTIEDFTDQRKRLQELSDRMTAENATEDDRMRYYRQLYSDRLSRIAFLLSIAEEHVIELPQGIWVDGMIETWFEEHVRIARDRLRKKRERELFLLRSGQKNPFKAPKASDDDSAAAG